jgi:branched-chain amino acid transport system ATP-binding protein
MILTATGLTKRFGGIRALDGVDLSVARGELVGIIGPNGSGKTTLFNVITGIYRPDRGGVHFEACAIAGRAPHAINRLGIARTFQNIRLFRNLSVLDNVRIAHHPHVAYGFFSALCRNKAFLEGERAMREKALAFLDLFGLRDRKDEPARNLPYGDQRRLEIARAIATGPRLLLLDEPAAGMNPYEVAQLMTFISEIRERFRLTILLIEHQMRLVMCLCERVVVMDFGQVIAEGPPAAIRENPRVLAAYLGREAVEEP